jgi:hypothetical protein
MLPSRCANWQQKENKSPPSLDQRTLTGTWQKRAD